MFMTTAGWIYGWEVSNLKIKTLFDNWCNEIRSTLSTKKVQALLLSWYGHYAEDHFDGSEA